MKITTAITKRQCYIFSLCLVALVGALFLDTSKASKVEEQVAVEQPTVEANTIVTIPIEQVVEKEEAFVYYQIPERFVEAGGHLSEVTQRYLWEECKERGVDYYVALALIERESGYVCDAIGDDGNSFGYMQIYEYWHKDRMAEENITCLFRAEDNIRVGLNFLQELINGEEDVDYHYVLTSYNMGQKRTKELFAEGVCSSKYSRAILQRAGEIEQELTQE